MSTIIKTLKDGTEKRYKTDVMFSPEDAHGIDDAMRYDDVVNHIDGAWDRSTVTFTATGVSPVEFSVVEFEPCTIRIDVTDVVFPCWKEIELGEVNGGDDGTEDYYGNPGITLQGVTWEVSAYGKLRRLIAEYYLGPDQELNK